MSQTEIKNRQITEAAIAEFQERGFAGASMDRISERAQVSKRTVYNHFESKELLFKAITDCLLKRFDASLEIAFNKDAPIGDELVRLGWTQGDMLIDPDAMRMARMMMGELIRDPEFSQNVNRRMDLLRVVARFLDSAVEAGKLDIRDTWVAAEQFVGLIDSRGFFPKLIGGGVVTRDEMARIIDDAVEMFLKSYGATATQAVAREVV